MYEYHSTYVPFGADTEKIETATTKGARLDRRSTQFINAYAAEGWEVCDTNLSYASIPAVLAVVFRRELK
jgi:ATP phosphoribosyltransferase regulatory subunit HisZ